MYAFLFKTLHPIFNNFALGAKSFLDIAIYLVSIVFQNLI